MTEVNFKQYDNTAVIAPYLDVHMMNPLLDFLREVKLYDSSIIAKEKIKIFIKTNMLELVQDEINHVADDSVIKNNLALSTTEIEKRTNEIFAKIDNESNSIKLCNKFFSNSEISGPGSNLSLDYISVNHGITSSILEEYYKFAKFKYDCGMYSEAEDMLGKYLSVGQPQSNSVLGALWGRLACRILQAKWEESLGDFNAIKDAIENRSIPPMDQLRQRAWLMHWALLVFLNQRNGIDSLVEFYSEKVYLQTLENLCPWLLRYYTCAIILSSKRRTLLFDLLTEIQSISYLYSDPITQLIELLYDSYDLETSQASLNTIHTIIKNDFFLQIYSDKLLHTIRLMLCEIYCSINHRVSIPNLSTILQLNEIETEKWIVEMLTNTTNDLLNSSNNKNNNNNSNNNNNKSNDNSLTATTTVSNLLTTSSGIGLDQMNVRIDSDKQEVVIDPPTRVIYQRIIERTKDLNMRSGILNTNLENLINDQGNYILLYQSAKNLK